MQLLLIDYTYDVEYVTQTTETPFYSFDHTGPYYFIGSIFLPNDMWPSTMHTVYTPTTKRMTLNFAFSKVTHCPVNGAFEVSTFFH